MNTKLDTEPVQLIKNHEFISASEKPIALQTRNPVVGFSMMLEKAISSDVDIQKMERLSDLLQRAIDDQRRQQFLEALAGFQSELTPCPKTIRADMGTYYFMYADLGVLVRHIQPLLKTYELTFRWEPKIIRHESVEIVQAICVAGHRGGWQQETPWWATIDRQQTVEPKKRKSPDKQESSALTVAQRRSLGASFGIVTEEDVDAAKIAREAAANKPGSSSSYGDKTATEKQIALLNRRKDEKNISAKEICEAFNVEAFSELKMGEVNKVLDYISSQ